MPSPREAWLRAPIPGIDPTLMPAAHALVQASEDLARAADGLSIVELRTKPGDAASVGFHLQHSRGSLGRLLTYARGRALDLEQMRELAAEGQPGDPPVDADTLVRRPHHLRGERNMRRWSVLALLVAAPISGAAQAPPAGSTEPFVVEYYYKARWGHADEFIRLFKKNHFPVLKREIELGHIQQVTAEAPRFHGTEEGRWDYRVTIVWKNAAAPHEPFPEAELRRLFPDQDAFRREEQQRFEILLAHWDVPVVTVDLTRP